MSRSRALRWAVAWLILAGAGAGPQPALACAACAQAGDSGLVDGARAGVLVMAGIVYVVLTGMMGLAAFWFVRARRLSRQATLGPPPWAVPPHVVVGVEPGRT